MEEGQGRVGPVTDGALGLDGLLDWNQARFVARTAGRALAERNARLDESAGAHLAQPLLTVHDDPAADSSALDGYAVCGEGPWQLVELAEGVALSPHTCCKVLVGMPVPLHADSVIHHNHAVVEARSGGASIITARDELSGVPDESARPAFGHGIIRQGERAPGGSQLIAAGARITPAVLALAASTGHDSLTVIPPPRVGTLILGAELLDRGLPRFGRPRDALGHTIPAFIGELGARGFPPTRAPDSPQLLLEEINDANVDVLITTGSTAPGPNSHLRQVLRDLGAHWLVDGVMVQPGAPMLLARLPDGRLLIGLPGDPIGALCALMTLATPLIMAMRHDATPPARTVTLADDAPAADFAEDTAIHPVRIDDGAAVLLAPDLHGWAMAHSYVVAPPGTGVRGDTLLVLDHLGR